MENSKHNKPVRCAIYCRYSSHAQDRGVSIEMQLDSCHKVASGKPLEFIDRAVTGRTMQRAAFRQMLDAAERHEFDRLIVYKWDRFGRNAETHATIADLEDLGIHVTSATEGDDFLARGVGLLVSEDYSRKLSQRISDSMKIRFKNHHSFLGGQVAYGYTTYKDGELSRLKINPDEAAQVKLIYQLYLKESLGVKRIAARLAEKGYKSRKDKKWPWVSVNRILHNPLYTGEMRHGKYSDKVDRRTGKKKRIQHEEWATYQDESLRIISDRDFAEVQARLTKAANRDNRLPTSVRTFSRLVICGTCGSTMYSQRSGTDNHYLSCNKKEERGRLVCTNVRHPSEAALLEWVQGHIRQILADRDKVINRAVEIAEKSLDRSDGRRSKIEADISILEASIAKHSAFLKNPSLNDDEMRGVFSQIGRLEGERDGLIANLKAVGSESSIDRKALIREIQAAMDEAEESIIDVAAPAVVNRAIERFVGQIVVAEDGSWASADPSGIQSSQQT